MKKLLVIVLVSFMFFTQGFLLDGNGQPQAASETTLKCAQPSAVTHPNQAGLRLMAELVSEKTGGKIQIKVFGGGVLGGERDQNEGVQIGTIDMGYTTTGVFSTFVPEMNVLSLPFLFEDTEHFKKFETSKVAEKLLAKCEKYGFKGLGFGVPVFREPLNAKRPINRPEDFKGLKIRLMEVPIHLDTYAAMGASPTPMAFGEVYSAMQLGVVDGCENALASLYSQKFYEVSKYLSRLPVFSNACILVMNLDKWKKLSRKQQKALSESARKGLDLIDEGYLAKADEALAVMKKAGIVINAPPSIDPFIEVTKSVHAKHIPKMPAGSQEIINEIRALAK